MLWCSGLSNAQCQAICHQQTCCGVRDKGRHRFSKDKSHGGQELSHSGKWDGIHVLVHLSSWQNTFQISVGFCWSWFSSEKKIRCGFWGVGWFGVCHLLIWGSYSNPKVCYVDIYVTAGRRLSGVSGTESSASLCSLTAAYDLPTQGMHKQSAREYAAAINKAVKEEKDGK